MQSSTVQGVYYMQRITVNLGEGDYEKLSKIAKEKRIPISVLARSLLVEKLYESMGERHEKTFMG